MPNLLSLASSGLVAFQNAIAVTGNNIANVNTEGYSRQDLVFDSRNSTRLGAEYVGNGVDINEIRRMGDDLANMRYRNSMSLDGYLTKYYELTSELDSLLSGEFTSVANGIQSFYGALQNVVASPDHLPSREAFLSQADLLVNRIGVLDQQFNEQFNQGNLQINAMTSQINTLSSSLVDVNRQIIASSVVDPILLDQRDQLLVEMSKLVNTTVTIQDNDSVNVSIGTGQSLVVGAVANELSVARDSSDPRQFAIFVNANGNQVPITDNISGGSLGAVLNYRNETLIPTSNALSRIALAISDSINEQHQLGMDMNDNLGGLFFSDINSTYLQSTRVVNNTNNSGTANFTVAIADTSQLTTSDYRLNVTTGPAYSLVRLSDNTSTNIAAFPATVDGFTLTLASGAAAVGDSFIVSPTRNAADEMSRAISDPTQLALASPIRTTAVVSNTGSGQITPGEVVDATTSAFTTTAKALAPPIRIEFLSATSYQVVNATTSAVVEGPIAYSPTQDNAIFPTPGAFDPGYRASISGTVASGDQFNIQYNNGGVGDSRNAIKLADSQNLNSLESGSANFQSAYGIMLSDVGTRTSETRINMEAGSVLKSQALAALENKRGVNLDEEAANLLKYEQAYQAASQLINVADRLFSILMQTFQ